MFLPLGRFNWLRKHIGFTSVPGCPDHGSLTLIRIHDEAGNVIETHEQAISKIGKCSAALLIAAIVGAAVQL
jgi:hypothetical protein